MSNNAVIAIPKERVSLIEKMAEKFHIEPNKMLSALKATAFKLSQGEVSNEQMVSLLVVADQYGLNPWTKEIYAFPDKHGGVTPVVGVDGWSRIINDHPQSDGFEFRESEKVVTPEGGKACPEWMEVIIHRKDRAHPIIVREYIDEVYRPPFKKEGRDIPGPWQTHTKRLFRHKVLIQGARIAYGFSGIYDEDEAQRIIEGEFVNVGEAMMIEHEGMKTAKTAQELAEIFTALSIEDKKRYLPYYEVRKKEFQDAATV